MKANANAPRCLCLCSKWGENMKNSQPSLRSSVLFQRSCALLFRLNFRLTEKWRLFPSDKKTAFGDNKRRWKFESFDGELFRKGTVLKGPACLSALEIFCWKHLVNEGARIRPSPFDYTMCVLSWGPVHTGRIYKHPNLRANPLMLLVSCVNTPIDCSAFHYLHGVCCEVLCILCEWGQRIHETWCTCLSWCEQKYKMTKAENSKVVKRYQKATSERKMEILSRNFFRPLKLHSWTQNRLKSMLLGWQPKEKGRKVLSEISKWS